MEFIKACFKDAILKDDYIYFFDNRIQAVCKMNIHNYEAKIISRYEDKNIFFGRKIFAFHGKYHIVEGNSARVLVYDEQISEAALAFRLYIPSIRCDSMAYEAYEYENFIYFFPPSMNEKIICFDTCCQKYSGFFFDESLLGKIIGEKKIYIGYTCLYKDEVWLPMRGTRFYMKYNLIKRKSEIFQARDKKATLSGICFDGRDIWMAQEGEDSIICDRKKKIKVSGSQSDVRIYDTKEFIIVAPRNVSELTLICKDDYELKIVKLPFDDMAKEGNQSRIITGFCELEEYIFLFCHEVSDLYVLEKKTLEIKSIILRYENYVEHYLGQEREIFDEQEDINLEYFIQFLQENGKNIFTQKKCKYVLWKNLV